jgi:hypothetical protein
MHPGFAELDALSTEELCLRAFALVCEGRDIGYRLDGDHHAAQATMPLA